MSAGGDIVDKKIFYPTENEAVTVLPEIPKELVYVLAIAHSIVEVPHSCGYAFLFRVGDALLMDLRDAYDPHCVYRTTLDISVHTPEEHLCLEELYGESGSGKTTCKHVCSFSWEPKVIEVQDDHCLDTGEFYRINISFDSDGPKVNISDCLYKSQPCKSLLWVDGGFLVAIVEMGDGLVLEMSVLWHVVLLVMASLSKFTNMLLDFVCQQRQPILKASFVFSFPYNLITIIYSNEIYELQHVRLQYELSCAVLPVGVGMGNTFVIGTHKPSVEILSFTPQGLRLLGTGTISLTTTMETAISGCIPQDIRLVLVDQFYVLAGLRNGMLLRKGREFLFNTRTNFFGSQTCSVNMGVKDDLPVTLQLIATRRIGITPVYLVPLSNSLDADIIALSDRPWLLHTARHSLLIHLYHSNLQRMQPLCVLVNALKEFYLLQKTVYIWAVGMNKWVHNSGGNCGVVHGKRLNVQKFHIGGTPRKLLYHGDKKLLVLMRTGLSNDTCSSEICCVDPLSGSVVSSYKLQLGETGKCMELVRAGTKQVLVVGTSLSRGPAIMPSGEAESSEGRLIVLCIEHVKKSDGSSMTVSSMAGSSSQRNSLFLELVNYATKQLSSSNIGSSPDYTSCDGVKLEETEAWQLWLVYTVTLPGMVLAICPHLDSYFLASAGNALHVFGFLGGNPQRVKIYATARTRFMITSLTAYRTRIAVGDCRDGILFYLYNEGTKKLEQTYCDPSQRLVADCALIDVNTAVVSDRKGSIAVLSCSDRLEGKFDVKFCMKS
ncbi:Mediator of RNA polymerase II transcription subunit 7 isoform 1 [Hibiscus syriacus]|uniref:Mediator of RNA polymerase II transcription subunit 7 isoform 1 n=1 Tax=Hibiscus syriacus TaxID=106335 RepID=A0A6A3CD09_HIBSY|nr:Mediator of RNA polymerase II transcription subunit 7 isoform 1 [Hibiscus syriacus]